MTTPMALYALSFGLALAISLCLTPAVRALARRTGIVDAPDGKRKLHGRPIPMLGGVAVFVSFYICLLLIVVQLESPSARSAFQLASATFVPSLLILALGILDDKRPVGPWTKMAVQIVAGLIVYYQLGIRIDTIAPMFGPDSTMLGLLSLPATLFWIVLITNAFNVVDGMDGLATGVSFIALVCMFMVSIQMNQPAIAFAAAPLAGAVLGFLRYNFHPASIFLGDSGSLFLGFQLAVLSIVGSQKSSTAVAVAAPIFVLALPLIETATSAVRRWVSGRSIMQADAGHIHHQLMRLGCTPRRAAGILYLGSGAFGLASLFMIQSGSSSIGLIALSFFVVTIVAIQQLGYTEFAEINGALRRFASLRKSIENGIVCRKLADDLASAASVGDAWSILKNTARRLGFSYVELALHAQPGIEDAPVPRYAERLMPAPGSAQPPETTFAVALAGRGHGPGQVVFSRPPAAPPLHSELPLLISAVADNLPRVIERHFNRRSTARRSEQVSPPAVRAAVESGDEPVKWHGSHAAACALCGSSRLFRSRSRSTLEQARKRLTSRRLYECASCGWRGWMSPATGAQHQQAPGAPLSPPDLQALDLALRGIRSVHQQSR